MVCITTLNSQKVILHIGGDGCSLWRILFYYDLARLDFKSVVWQDVVEVDQE